MRRYLEPPSRTVIKNHLALDFGFVPKELPHREEQLDKLGSLFQPLLQHGLPEHARFRGPVGSGKTVSAKRFCQDAKDEAQKQGRALDYVLINCRSRPSDGAVLLRIIKHFDPGFPDRGFSISEMLNSLQRHLASRKLNLIVVLDEADRLLKAQKSDLIYQLTRLNEEGRISWNVSLILISQIDLKDYLDPASLSTLKPTNVINFPSYTAEELADLVRQRVELGFYPGTVSDELIHQIGLTAARKTPGDARYAIEVLHKAGGAADREKSDVVQPEHVREASEGTYSTVSVNTVDDLPLHAKLASLACARALKRKTQVSTGDLHKTYAVACEEVGEKPRGQTQFWKYLKLIESQGLIEQRLGKAGVGNTTLVSLTDVKAEELEKYIEGLLEEGRAASAPEPEDEEV